MGLERAQTYVSQIGPYNYWQSYYDYNGIEMGETGTRQRVRLWGRRTAAQNAVRYGL